MDYSDKCKTTVKKLTLSEKQEQKFCKKPKWSKKVKLEEAKNHPEKLKIKQKGAAR